MPKIYYNFASSFNMMKSCEHQKNVTVGSWQCLHCKSCLNFCSDEKGQYVDCERKWSEIDKIHWEQKYEENDRMIFQAKHDQLNFNVVLVGKDGVWMVSSNLLAKNSVMFDAVDIKDAKIQALEIIKTFIERGLKEGADFISILRSSIASLVIE